MKITSTVLMLACGLWCLSASAQCTNTLPTAGTRDDVLIIVNANVTESCVVGYYYAEKRGVAESNIAQIYASPNFFVNWGEFVVIRDQLIAKMQALIKQRDPTFLPYVCIGGGSPYYCQASMDQLRANTRIKYLITTKGVPSRFVPPGVGAEAASFDNILRQWLIEYFPNNYFPYGSPIPSDAVYRRAIAFGDGRGMRTVLPATDRELIIGRIDGLTLNTAKALIDRAILAEQTGLYGKVYGSSNVPIAGAATFGWQDFSSWISSNASPPRVDVYAGGSNKDFRNNDPWRYQFGMFAEDRPECADYTSNYLSQNANSAVGKVPEHCRVAINNHLLSDPPPGRAGSRSPTPDNALVYLGELDGQKSTGSYNDFLNWRHTDTCPDYPAGTPPLCNNLPLAQQAACLSASVDALKKIDTRCAGVADGFIGYNHQSFPVSYFTIWPRDWGPPGASIPHVFFPRLRQDFGHLDSTSLWFDRSNNIGSVCYPSSVNIAGTKPTQACNDPRLSLVDRVLSLPASVIASNVTPVNFKLVFWTHYDGNTQDARVQANLARYDSAGKQILISGPFVVVSATAPGWQRHEVTFTVAPTVAVNISKLRLTLSSSSTTGAFVKLGLDDISFQQVTADAPELLTNNSFDQGYGVTIGDHAANFLSRLNGTAFWGSTSHYKSGGHSFAGHALETLIYFFRGLPLGDAVWFYEPMPSGLFYGDPLYRPVEIKLDYPIRNDFADRFVGTLNISGSTINGWDPTLSDAQYQLDYCAGDDFYKCDKALSWQTLQTGAGKVVNASLTTLDGNLLPRGDVLVRLRVTTTRRTDATRQVLQDFTRVRNWTGCPLSMATALPTDLSDWDDTDGNGILNPCDSDDDGDGFIDTIDAFPRDPAEWLDTDSDGIGNNADLDDDNDGLSDIEELALGTSPLLWDTDGDFISDKDEVVQGTNPLVANYEKFLPVVQLFMKW